MARDRRILLLMAVSLLARPVIVEDAPLREDNIDMLLRPREDMLRITLPAERMTRDNIVLRDHFCVSATREYPAVPQTLSSQRAMRQPQVRGHRLYRR